MDFSLMDETSKAIFIVLVFIVAYIFALIPLGMVLDPSSTLAERMMNFETPELRLLNMLAVVVALAVGFLVSYNIALAQRDEPEHQLEIIKKALSDDERLIIEEVERSGEITQDSLRFRLDWSKAKVSTVLSNLDRMGVIQRERMGKTYKVFLDSSRVS